MTPLRKRMIEDMNLAGLAPKTQQLYIEAVIKLAKHYRRAPDTLSEEEIRSFFLYVRDHEMAAEATLRILHYGLKFFYQNTLQRDWPVLKLIRSRRKARLPTILSLAEIKALLRRIRIPRNRVCLALIYACGLRISEATNLRVDDIDSRRMLIKVHGKGAKDRYVPLSPPMLAKLREYWRSHRSRPWLFPGYNPGLPVSTHAVRQALHAAVAQAGLTKYVVPHSLRHTYATHLLENKVDIRVIQILLGHKNTSTTALYTRLTPQIMENVQKTVQRLTNDL